MVDRPVIVIITNPAGTAMLYEQWCAMLKMIDAAVVVMDEANYDWVIMDEAASINSRQWDKMRLFGERYGTKRLSELIDKMDIPEIAAMDERPKNKPWYRHRSRW